jgi:DNA-binding SARP family transcriptional activator
MRVGPRRGTEGVAKAHRRGNYVPSRALPRQPGGVSHGSRHSDMAASPAAPKDRPYRLALFRGPVLVKGDEALLLSGQALQLLGVLGAHGSGGVSRPELGNFLWKTGTWTAQRRRLSQLLLTIRTKVEQPDIVVAVGDRLALNPQLVLTDLEELRAAIEEAAFDRAMDILDGGFFTDVSGRLTQRLTEWIGHCQIEHRAEVRRALAEAGQLSEGISDFAGIVRTAELQVRLDPDDETHLRRLLKALAMQGKVAQARAAFRHHEERMRLTDPEWEADEETVRLRGELGGLSKARRKAIVRAARVGDVRRPGVPTAEVEVVTEALALDGIERPSSITISGVRGVGKSWHSARVVAALTGAGWSSYTIRCSRTLRDHPFAAIGQLQVRGWDGHAGPSVSHTAHRLKSALDAARKGSGTIIVVEDVAWCDGPSRCTLELLVRVMGEGSVCLVVTGTPAQIQIERRRWLDRIGPVLPVRLEGLSERSVAEFLQNSGAPKEAVEEGGERVRYFGGSPGLLRLDRWCVDLPRRAPPYLDEPTRAVISEWLSGGPSRATDCLVALSCGPEAWREEDIQMVLGVSPGICDTALAFLEDAGMARRDGGGWALVAPVFRDFARRLEGRAATEVRRMIAQRATEACFPAGQLADIWSLTADRESTVRFARTAAQAAEREGAILPRVKYLRIAHQAIGDRDGAQQVRLDLALALLAARELQEAIPLIRRASSDALKDGDYPGWLSGQILTEDAKGHLEGGRPREVAERLLALVDTCLEHGAVVQATTSLSLSLHHFHRTGDEGRVRDVFAKARELLRGPLPSEAEVRLLMTLAVETYYGNALEGVRSAKQAVDKSGDCGNRTLELGALNRYLTVLIATGRLSSPEGAAVASEALRLASQVGDLLERTHPLINLAVWDADAGDYDSCAARLIRTIPLVENAQDKRPLLVMLCNLGVAQLRGGGFRTAGSTLRRAFGLLEAWSSEEVRAQILAGLGWVALEEGSLREASSYFEELSSKPLCRSADVTTTTLFGARVLRRRGEIARAVALYEEGLNRTRGHFPLHHVALVAERSRALPSTAKLSKWPDELELARTTAAELGATRWHARLSALTLAR